MTTTANRLALVAVLCWSASVPLVSGQPVVQPCLLCPEEGMTFQDPYKVLVPGQDLPKDVMSRSQTCAFLQTWATAGGMGDEECQALQDAGVDEVCACGFPQTATTDAPVPAAVEDGPTTSDEDFYISLQPVTGEHTGKSVEGLTMACESLFAEHYPEEGGLLAVTCDPIETQRSYAGRRRQLLRPAQQQRIRALDDAAKIDVIMRVTVELSSGSEPLGEADMLTIWNDNEEDFIDSLKTEGSPESQLYYANVTMVKVTADDTLPEPVVDESETSNDSDDGLSGGALAGIIVGAIAAVIGVALVCRGKTQELTAIVADPVDQVKNRSRSNEMLKSSTTPTVNKSTPKPPKESEVAIDPTFTNDSDSGDKLPEVKFMYDDKFMYETVTITAPAGKMGIDIDKTEDLMVVREIKPGSVLENQVLEGDIIIKVNDQDTRGMSSKDLQQFLVDTEGQERTLKINREVDDSTHC